MSSQRAAGLARARERTSARQTSLIPFSFSYFMFLLSGIT